MKIIIKKLMEEYPWLPYELAKRYAGYYGLLCEIMLNDAQSIADLGEYFGAGLYQIEVDYLINHEWAKNC